MIRCMPRVAARALLVLAGCGVATGVLAGERGAPGCVQLTARQCLGRAITAMGGADRLQAVRDIELQGVGHTRLAEQSYRQQPYQTSYQHFHRWLDLAGRRARLQSRLSWPQAGDTSPVERPSTVIVTPDGGLYQAGPRQMAAPASIRDDVRAMLATDPVRLLLTAQAAADLRYAAPESLHGVEHAVLAFSVDGQPQRVLLDPYNHLPDAIESTRTFDDFWYAWGDVRQRVCFDNWILVDGIPYPTTRVTYRNGLEWRSEQLLQVRFNGPVAADAFALPALARQPGAGGSRWERPFQPSRHQQLAPGIDFYPGAWNATLIRQQDGVLVLEAPISPVYTRGILARAHALYPKLPIKAVLTTSDAWPHAGGVREAVAEGLPVYALDLNLPLLKRLVAAPHTLHPDVLQQHPRLPQWRVVSAPRVIGHGANRLELYPLRGADTGRQYMVYFPARQLLYASDTLVLDDTTGALYQPELMHEVVQAVQREHLRVRTVYAMHQGPTPWSKVLKLVEAARRGPRALNASGG